MLAVVVARQLIITRIGVQSDRLELVAPTLLDDGRKQPRADAGIVDVGGDAETVNVRQIVGQLLKADRADDLTVEFGDVYMMRGNVVQNVVDRLDQTADHVIGVQFVVIEGKRLVRDR